MTSFQEAVRQVSEKNVLDANNDRISVLPSPEVGRMYCSPVPDGFRCLGTVHLTGNGVDRRGALLWSRERGTYWMRSQTPDVMRCLNSTSVEEAIQRAR